MNFLSKLVYSNLNYRIGTSTAALFLSNDHSLYASITSHECHALFHLYGTSRPARNGFESDKIQNEKFLLTVGLGSSTLIFLACCSTDRVILALLRVVLLKWYLYIHLRPIPMYTCSRVLRWSVSSCFAC